MLYLIQKNHLERRILSDSITYTRNIAVLS